MYRTEDVNGLYFVCVECKNKQPANYAEAKLAMGLEPMPCKFCGGPCQMGKMPESE